jgi:hypothetical protein
VGGGGRLGRRAAIFVVPVLFCEVTSNLFTWAVAHGSPSSALVVAVASHLCWFSWQCPGLFVLLPCIAG